MEFINRMYITNIFEKHLTFKNKTHFTRLIIKNMLFNGFLQSHGIIYKSNYFLIGLIKK